MIRFTALVLVLIAMAGCRPVTIGMSHASTDKGYLNSALRDLGQLYLLDTTNGNLTELAVLELSNRVRGKTFERQVARDVRGVDIDAEVKVAVRARVETEIARNSYIELDNAFDVSYSETFSDLSAEINRREAAGEEVSFSWFLDEASQPASNLRYLLVYSTIRADAARVGYSDITAVGGGLTIPLRGAGDVDVSVTGLSEEAFKGKAVPVLVDYHVIQAFKRDGFYKFRIDRSFDKDALSDVLKGRVDQSEVDG